MNLPAFTDFQIGTHSMLTDTDLTGKHVFDGSDASGVIGAPTDSIDHAI